MNLKPIAVFTISAGLLLAPARAQEATPKAHEHSMPAPGAGGMDHGKMLADMKAADARLEALARTMTAAVGHDQIGAMRDLLAELVRNQVDMHRQMSMMHDHMMAEMSHK
jgi:hypothetical protein